MFILELYFLLYRVPKMMAQLARARGLSAWRWSLLGIAAWILAEVGVLFVAGVLYGVGKILFGWPEPISAGYKFVSYVIALVAALLAVTLLSRGLTRRRKEEELPPAPPQFN